MIKLKSLLKEEMTSLGNMKVSIQLGELHFTLHQDTKGNIYVYPLDQTRLYKALEKFGEKGVIEPLINKVNNKYGEAGFYKLASKVEATKPIIFNFISND